MKPVRFTVDNKSESAELYIYDDIGASFWSDGITAKAVADALKELKAVKNLTVRINSPGGNVFDGMAIRNQLLQSGKRITVHVDGIAASIASVIAMVGSEIHMADGGMMMIHDPWSDTRGDSEELRKTAEILDQIGGEIASIYAKRTNSQADAMRDLMKVETWMTPSEAMDRGFITHVAEPMNIAAKIDPNRFKYKNIPQQFLPSAKADEPVAEKEAEVDPLAEAKAKIEANRKFLEGVKP